MRTYAHIDGYKHTHCTCRAANIIISSSVHSISSSRMAHLACSYSWFTRMASYCGKGAGGGGERADTGADTHKRINRL